MVLVTSLALQGDKRMVLPHHSLLHEISFGGEWVLQSLSSSHVVHFCLSCKSTLYCHFHGLASNPHFPFQILSQFFIKLGGFCTTWWHRHHSSISTGNVFIIQLVEIVKFLVITGPYGCQKFKKVLN